MKSLQLSLWYLAVLISLILVVAEIANSLGVIPDPYFIYNEVKYDFDEHAYVSFSMILQGFIFVSLAWHFRLNWMTLLVSFICAIRPILAILGYLPKNMMIWSVSVILLSLLTLFSKSDYPFATRSFGGFNILMLLFFVIIKVSPTMSKVEKVLASEICYYYVIPTIDVILFILMVRFISRQNKETKPDLDLTD